MGPQGTPTLIRKLIGFGPLFFKWAQFDELKKNNEKNIRLRGSHSTTEKANICFECHKGLRGPTISEGVTAGWKERSEALRAALCQCVDPQGKRRQM